MNRERESEVRGRRFQFFNYHGGIIGRKLRAVKEPANSTNPTHEKVSLGEEILTSEDAARQSRDGNPKLPQKNAHPP